MFCTCSNVQNMSKMIQVRNVSEETHRTLKSRAASAGMSLSDYIKRDLERMAARPSPEEFEARLLARGPVDVDGNRIAGWIREARDS